MESIKKIKITKLHWIFLTFTAILAFVFFTQEFDMKLNMLHGIDLINTLFDKNNFMNFYNYTLEKSLNGEYIRGAGWPGCGAVYNIVVYVFMAFLSLPVLIFKSFLSPEIFQEVLLHWSRILMVIFSLICSYLIYKLLRKVGYDKHTAHLSQYLFLSSPITIFCILIFTQIDVISIIITLISLFFFFDKKYYKFSFIIGIAICFKVFSILLFLPLILLVEKKLLKLLTYVFSALSLYGFTTILCMLFDSGYKRALNAITPMYNFWEWLIRSIIPVGRGNISLFFLFIFFICLIAYITDSSKIDIFKATILLCLASYTSLFCFAYYHCYWKVIIVPFFVMCIVIVKDLKLSLILESIASLCYMLITPVEFSSAFLFGNTIYSYFLKYKDINLEVNEKYFYLIRNFLINNEMIYTLIITLMVGSMISLILVLAKDMICKKEYFYTDNNILDVKIMIIFRMLIIYVYMLPAILSIIIK